MNKVSTAMQRLQKDESGNFGIMTALLMPVLFLGASVALNVANATKEAERMQDALDAAAIKAVSSYAEGASENAVQTEANRLFSANFQPPSAAEEYSSGSLETPAVEAPAVQLAFSEVGQETRATASYAAEYDPVFWGLTPFVISRKSVAARQADREACILALNPTASRAIEVSGSAAVDTSNCTITSNSDDAQSIYLSGTATLKAECLYATGKIYATLAHLELGCEQAREGVSRTPDPFKKKAVPTAGNWVSLSGCGQAFVGNGGGNGDCNGTGKTPNKIPDGYSVTLKPGSYGELEIKGKVSLQPGNYIIDGGVLKFTSQSAVSGEGVTFFLLNGAEVDLHGGSNFHVTAATSGDWAGFVIVAARNNTEPAVINGNSNSSLSGIIYMPASQEIQYSGNGSTGGECVRIIAQEITMTGNSGFAIDCESELADNQIMNPGAIRLVQ